MKRVPRSDEESEAAAVQGPVLPGRSGQSCGPDPGASRQKERKPAPLVRCFSTSVARPFAKLVRPPVQIYGVEGRYATALYSAASKQNKLEQVEKELARVAQLLKEPKMAASILNPFTKRSIKVKSLNDMTTKEKFSPLTSNLINLLAENGRLTSTPAVISAFSTMMSVHRGEVPCTVTTASVSEGLWPLRSPGIPCIAFGRTKKRKRAKIGAWGKVTCPGGLLCSPASVSLRSGAAA